MSWPLVLGLGAVALLWPLMQLTGLADAIGRQATPLVVALAVALVWVGVVGLGRAPRPVLTLTLAGVAYGVYLLVLGIVLGPALGDGGIPLSAIPWAMAPMLALDAFYGFLAGLLALVVQNVRGGRS
ncbi:hypothetical protein GB881_13725 [Georgenia subflava]|uniref:Uncharacterized protein n=1 Tax=Georgenia subflava TaxID=1622177 RepID=A0A6N7EJ37_9MICO|nr:hypothetical protein [Georgenia subflava]